MRRWCGKGWPASPDPGRYFTAMASAAIAMLSAHPNAARADPAEPTQPKYGWVEVFGGADATRDVWLLYSGVTLAPWSKDIYSDGVRLRVVSGYGQYNYEGLRLRDTFASHDAQKVRFHAETEFTDAMIGYQTRFGELTAKAFVGFSGINHDIAPHDCFYHRVKDSKPAQYTTVCNRASGLDYGIKGALELWLNLDDNSWTSLNLSHTTAHDTSAASWRYGVRVLPTVSIGSEMRFNRSSGNVNIDPQPGDPSGFQYSARTGGFIRYEWLGGEVSLAGGVASQMIDFGMKANTRYEPYLTLGVSMKY